MIDDITNRRFDKLDADIEKLEADIADVRTEMRTGFTGLRTEMVEIKSDIARHFRELMQEGIKQGAVLGRLTAWLDDDTRSRVIKLEDRVGDLEKIVSPKQD